MTDLLIRRRRDADLPPLVEILERQQPETEYPFDWPPSVPVEQFIRRQHELGAWVAQLGDAVVGHVSLQGVEETTSTGEPNELGLMWAQAHDVSVSLLRCVSVLFADRRYAGQGIGSTLLRTATEAALADGGAPVLDVVPHHVEPLHLYRRRGWQEIGRFRTEWLPDDVEPVYVMIYPRDRTLT